jgi:hypothetical protein
MPVPDPVLVLGAQALAGRPAAFNGAHLRNRDGRPLTRRHFERWSRVLHERAPWAQGHNLCLHCLRHSCAHLLRRRGLADSDIALWLGHDDRDRIGTTEVYLRLVGDEVWTRRGQIYRQAFGPLNRWPDLPETSVLGPIIRTVLMRPQTPTTSAIPATSSSAGPLGAPASSQPVGGAGAPQFLAPGSAPAGATEPAGNRPDSPTELGSKPLPGQDADAQRGPDQAAEDL